MYKQQDKAGKGRDLKQHGRWKQDAFTNSPHWLFMSWKAMKGDSDLGEQKPGGTATVNPTAA